MSDDRVYLELPVPKGNGDAVKHVEIDQARWTRARAEQLFQKIRDGREKTSRWMPLASCETLLGDKIDLSEVIDVLNEVLKEIRPQITVFGEAGEMLIPILDKLQGFEQVFKLLEAFNVPAAAHELSTLIWDLLPVLIAPADEIFQATSTAEGMVAYGEHVQSETDKYKRRTDEEKERVIAESDERVRQAEDNYLKHYEAWAASAKALIATVDQLEEIEKGLRSEVNLTESELTGWKNRLKLSDERMAEAAEFLSEDFPSLIIPLNARGEPEDIPEMRELIEKATIYIEFCQNLCSQAEDTRETLYSIISNSMLTIRPRIRILCDDLKKHSKDLKRFCKQHSEDTPLYQALDGAFIEQEDYEKALAILKDMNWAPIGTDQRLNGLMNKAVSLTSSGIELPHDSVGRHIDLAQYYINEGNAIISDMSGKPGDMPPDSPSQSEPATSSQSDDQPSTESMAPRASYLTTVSTAEPKVQRSTTKDSSRAKELYELVICVGYVLTCKKPFLAFSTIKAMLDTLPFIKNARGEAIVTPVESDALRPAVLDLSHRAGQRETVRDRKQVTPRTKTIQTLWISYSPRKEQWGLKMTHFAETEALELIKKHSLSVESLRQAHTDKRAERQERIEREKRERKASQEEENEKSTEEGDEDK